tara:strand:- start:456 stop:785 length:330 start_codon:yes stop_codon:yes gene_type:complete
MTYLISLCVVSLGLNVFLIWYLRKTLFKLLFVSDNIGDLLIRLDEFGEHLNSIYSMETFYGDDVLHGLINHLKQLLIKIEDYKDIYSLTNDIEDFDPEAEEELDDEQTE